MTSSTQDFCSPEFTSAVPTGIKTTDAGTFVYLLIGYALTGFMVEGLIRGIALCARKPTGTTRTMVISSMLFGLVHIGNLLYRNPFIVFAQMIGALVHGIDLSATGLRANTTMSFRWTGCRSHC